MGSSKNNTRLFAYRILQSGDEEEERVENKSKFTL